MMTLEAVRAALADRNLSEIARRTGISYHKVWRIMKGEGSPAYETVETLSKYLAGDAAQ